MAYSIKEISKLAGITTRTLRYYDEIGLLTPQRDPSSKYRIYSAKDVDRLQQILFFREFDLNLEEIKNIIYNPKFSEVEALKNHKENLLKERDRLNQLIKNLDLTLENKIKGVKMIDSDKFKGFKENLIKENEKRYGKEAREKYEKEQVDASNQRLMNLSKQEYEAWENLSSEITRNLALAFKNGNSSGQLAQKAVELHRRWLTVAWGNYSAEMHANLGQMYVDDERFKAYYDKDQPGTAEFLRDAILIYTKDKK